MVNGKTVALSFNQHPGAFQFAFHPLKFLTGFGFYKNVPALQTLGSRCITGRYKIERHGSITVHSPKPRAAIKTNGHLPHFLNFYFQSPAFQFIGNPIGGVRISIRAYRPSANTIGKYIQVFHGAVIVPTHFHDFLAHFVLCIHRNNGKKCKQKEKIPINCHSESI